MPYRRQHERADATRLCVTGSALYVLKGFTSVFQTISQAWRNETNNSAPLLSDERVS